MKRLLMVLFLATVVTTKAGEKEYQVGVFLGNRILPDATYTSEVHCDGLGSCTGSGGLNALRHYYVKTDEGTWDLVTEYQAESQSARSLGMSGPIHLRSEKPNLLDRLKPGDKFAFRAAKDHRIGAKKNYYHVYIPRADNPSKEDKFFGLRPNALPPEPVKPTNNIKALCDAGKLSGEPCK